MAGFQIPTVQQLPIPKGQHNSLVAHWLSVFGDHGSNPGGGEKIPLLFLSCDLMIADYLRIN